MNVYTVYGKTSKDKNFWSFDIFHSVVSLSANHDFIDQQYKSVKWYSKSFTAISHFWSTSKCCHNYTVYIVINYFNWRPTKFVIIMSFVILYEGRWWWWPIQDLSVRRMCEMKGATLKLMTVTVCNDPYIYIARVIVSDM